MLEYRLDGKNIAEVLAMSAAEAAEFFTKGPAHTTLVRMIDVGLGYITLGQALNTLSGGERQRLKLAISMAKKGAIYVLDEPTTGLHLADVDNMLGMLDRLVAAGNSVIVIEHHQAVMAHADWIIDLGPGAGHDGGAIVFEGTPADLVASGSADREAPEGVRRAPDAGGVAAERDVASAPFDTALRAYSGTGHRDWRGRRPQADAGAC